MWATIRKEVYLVDKLEPKLLLGMDVIATESMIIDASNGTVTLPHYRNAALPVACKRRGSIEHFPACNVRAATRTTIAPNTLSSVPICFGDPLPTVGGDFEFTSSLDNCYIRGYHYIVDATIHVVLVRNDSDELYIVDAFAKVGSLSE